MDRVEARLAHSDQARATRQAAGHTDGTVRKHGGRTAAILAEVAQQVPASSTAADAGQRERQGMAAVVDTC